MNRLNVSHFLKGRNSFAFKSIFLFAVVFSLSSLAFSQPIASNSRQADEIKEDSLTKSKPAPEPASLNLYVFDSVQLANMPFNLGDQDIFYALSMLPGFSMQGRQSNTFYVRGGNEASNMLLLDGVPVYNLNFFSYSPPINSDILGSVEFYNSGIPARYSGHSSSVINMQSREGSYDRVHGSAKVNLMKVSLMLEGPLGDKTSFLISGRRSLSDMLMSFAYRISLGLESMVIRMPAYDFNAKITHKFSENSKVSYSGYYANDHTQLEDSREYDFGNLHNELNDLIRFDDGNQFHKFSWSKIWSDRLSSDLSLYYSQYMSKEKDVTTEVTTELDSTGQIIPHETALQQIETYSGLNDLTIKSDFNFFVNEKQQMSFGMKGTHYNCYPELYFYSFESDINENLNLEMGDTLTANSLSLYVEDEIRITPWLRSHIGLSTTIFSSGSNTFIDVDPRIVVDVLFSSKLIFSASASKISQAIHKPQLYSYMFNEILMPSLNHIRPERSYNASAGFRYSFDKSWSMSIEGYYKEMKYLSYKEGDYIDFLESAWEDNIGLGEGLAYGTEFFLKKSKGDFTGSIAYSLSLNTRSFENINLGNAYSFEDHYPNRVVINVNYKFNEKISGGSVFYYGQGSTFTYVGYNYNTNDVVTFSSRRPSFFHSGIWVNFQKQKVSYLRVWNIGVYSSELSLLPILPSAQFSIKF